MGLDVTGDDPGTRNKGVCVRAIFAKCKQDSGIEPNNKQQYML